MKGELRKPASVNAILLIGIFTFVFLGAEYLFVNMISLSVTEGRTVIAQNYALGASAVGFFLYPAMERWGGRRYKSALTFILALGAIICTFIVQQHISYAATMTAGMVLFLLLGVFGSAVHYLAAVTIDGDNALARLAGIAYALGILLQYANNNLVNLEVAEAAFLSVFLAALSLLVIRTRQAAQSRIEMTETAGASSEPAEDISLTRKKRTAGIMLALLVVLMACVFSTLDNAVTLRHASGTDIGQWPRLLLAFSGLAAGFVFDIRKRKYMGLIMYCVMMMSVLSIVVLNLGAPFLIGLVVFYLSSGFFVVFFTASFMELSRHMRLPSLWAGMGRAMNNVSAALITNGSVALLATGNSLAAIVIALVLFVAVSVAMAVYTARMNAVMEPKEPPASQKSDEERREAFIAKYGLTEREWDVFSQMISSDSSAQEIADCLFLSKRTVERHISALYEKTGAKSRITMYPVTNCPDKKHRFPHLKNEIYAIRHPGKEKSGTKSTPQPLFGTIRSCAYIKPQNSCFDLYNMHKWRLTAIGFLKNGGSPPPVLIRLAGFTHRQSGLFSPKMRA